MKTLKIFFVFIFTNLFIFSGIGQKVKNDLTDLKLKGKVKSLTETEFKKILVDKSGEIQKAPIIINKYIYFFNDTGNIFEEDYYGLNDDFKYKDIYKYDDKGNLIERNRNNLTSYKNSYVYDEKDNIIEDSGYNSNSNSYEKTTFEYDNKGNIIVKTRFDINDSLISRDTCKYDTKGNKIESRFYTKSTALKLSYKYDNNGNRIEEYWCWLANSSFMKKIISKYNDKGNVIEAYSYKADGSIDNKFTYNYDYDEAGNWIKKTPFENGTAKNSIERKIVYY